MRSSTRNNAKGGNEDETKKKSLPQRTRMKTRPATSTLTSSPVATRRVETGKKLAASGRTHQSVGPSQSIARKPPIATPPPRKKEPETRRRTISAKPLCQRSQQRHEAFRASFEKMTLGEGKTAEKKRVVKDLAAMKKTRKGSIAGGSVPPRLPSVRTTSQTPSATPRPPRRRWFPATSPKPSPEPPFRSRKIREEATQQRFREQIGALPLKLDEARGVTPRSALALSPSSPRISSANRQASSSSGRRKMDVIYGQTPPPADADADAEEWEVEDDGWGGRQRYGHDNLYQDHVKQQFRLKSQQLQYQRMGQCQMGYYEDDSPLAIYERAEEEEVDLA